jgi:hypothetical protein
MKSKFKLPATDMAFRKVYKDLLEKELITVVFRPGTRLCGEFRSYCEGDIVTARVIKQVGLDRARVAPEFLKSPVKRIKIKSVRAIHINNVLNADFIGSYPDVYDKETLIYHLALIYNIDYESLASADGLVTRTEFDYL